MVRNNRNNLIVNPIIILGVIDEKGKIKCSF